MCIGSSSSFLSTFLLALACFIGIWNYTKIKNYILNKNNQGNSIYLKESWPSYKPLEDTDLITNINNIVNNQ